MDRRQLRHCSRLRHYPAGRQRLKLDLAAERRRYAARWEKMDGETAAHYRQEAERIRRDAKGMGNETIRRQLLAIAASYDGLAETVLMIARQRSELADKPIR